MNIVFWFFFIFFSLGYPFFLGDPEMFIESDPIISPVHIVPEWYFLFAYAILRAIPNKVLGVLSLFARILFFFIFVLVDNYVSVISKLNKLLVFIFILIFVILRWLGQCLVEDPYVLLRIIFSFLYFFVLFLLFLFY